MRRIGLAVVLVISLTLEPLVSRAQQAAKMWQIGFVEAGSSSVNRHFAEDFRQGLKELGNAEGRNIVIEVPATVASRRELSSRG
jgi:hypothetical protein